MKNMLEFNWRDEGAKAYRNSLSGLSGVQERLKVIRVVDWAKSKAEGIDRDPVEIYQRLERFGNGIKDEAARKNPQDTEAPGYVDEAIKKYKPNPPSNPQPGQPSP